MHPEHIVTIKSHKYYMAQLCGRGNVGELFTSEDWWEGIWQTFALNMPTIEGKDIDEWQSICQIHQYFSHCIIVLYGTFNTIM